MLFTLIILLVGLVTTRCSDISRKATTIDVNDFYRSFDEFVNHGNKTTCAKLNGTCVTSQCKTCRCSGGEAEVFVSYSNGCHDYASTKDILLDEEERRKGLTCLTHDAQDISNVIPLLKFNDTVCKSLYRRKSMTNFFGYECKAKEIEMINANGSKVDSTINNTLVEIETYIGNRCIKFKEKFFTAFEASLGRVELECTKSNEQIYETCFIFKVESFIQVPQTTTPPTPSISSTTSPVTSSTPLEVTSSPSTSQETTSQIKSTQDGKLTDGGDNNAPIIGGVVAVVVIMLILLVVFFLVYRRRKRQKNEKDELNNGGMTNRELPPAPLTNEKHYESLKMTDNIQDNNYLYIEANKRDQVEEAYSSVIKPPKDNNENTESVHKIDNPYYMTKDENKTNWRNSKSENPIYGDSDYSEVANNDNGNDEQLYAEVGDKNPGTYMFMNPGFEGDK